MSVSLKNLPLKNHLAKKAATCVEASPGSVESGLFKLWSLGVEWGHRKRSKLYRRIYREESVE